MANYQIQIKASASKELTNLEADLGRRVLQAIDTLATNPRPSQCIKLKGRKDSYRLRVGKIRVIYQIDDSLKSIMVYEVGYRRDVYR
ncbi:MAG: hypothetical protein HW399_348 [Dehalococcoidia bacterium]|nr:hypothetical protein [Dehalococcoidia bacterium]